MTARVLATVARIDALPRRERIALVGGLIALAIGVQALWVTPARAKRNAIAESSAQSERSRSDAEVAAAAQRAATFADLRSRNLDLEAKLAALGLKASQREPVGAFVTRSLRGDGVRLAGVTALPVEALASADPLRAHDASLAAESTDTATPVAARPALFRHRTELRLEGAVKDVVRAIEQLERDLAPLRVERIRLTPVASGSAGAGAIQASLVLTTISEERTWLAF